MTVKKWSNDPKDDRYYVRLYNPQGGQYKKIIRGKRAAELHHAEMRAKLARGSVAPSSARNKTVHELMTAILDAKPNLRVGTRNGYDNTIRLHIKPELGDLRVRELGYLTLTGFFERVEKNAGREARRTAESLVRNMLKVAVRERIIDRSPLDGVPFTRRPPVRGVPYAPEFVDLVRVRAHIARQRVNVLPGEIEMVTCMLDTLVGCGVRIGELLGIAPEEDVDLDRGTIRIVRQLLYLPKRGYIFGPPKTDESVRTVPAPKFVLASMATTQLRNGLREVTLPWADPDNAKLETHRLLFYSLRQPGAPYMPQVLQDRMARVGRRLALPGALHPHGCRHRYTTELDEAGVPQVVIDEITGHKPVGSMSRMTYSHSTDAGRAKARAAIQTAWAAAIVKATEAEAPSDRRDVG
ncbi:MAG TPA: tyrosine-type recombinase/integrase [Mycobacteriales bacterium]|nr:tyrosine-type recombinase/integrase [Mycobacteriales bacterium]